MDKVEIELVDGLPEMFKFLCDECFNSLKELHGKELRETFRKAKVMDLLGEGISEADLRRADKISTLSIKQYLEMEEKAKKYDELQKCSEEAKQDA